MNSRRFPLGLTFATTFAFALLVSLGVWQLQRLAWKQALLARVAALEAAPAAPLGPVLDRLGEGADVDFTRVSVTCPGLSAAPWLELYAVREGLAGARLVSACAVDSSRWRSILVDRGFVADVISARPPRDPADRTAVAISGVLRTPERPSAFAPANRPDRNRWYVRDLPAMAKALGAGAPAPVMLMAETSSNPGWKALVPAPLPAEIPNRHLEYALTWFGLAGALLAVYAAVLWRRWKS